ncbi:hypothetical protein M407DRAFT_212275 [Tulasnella calospora MUT 4182]|uniref:LNS2/PITP domain-containing protein n=1 Tax=Tulasnella calospora MUT 4182 TaxID=1051891 RepID=A0A0C3PM83_9AGAM|nr:hypothetical protein M407DRAFT_212275 [Tulasnella calospora MUT 4182]
MNLNDEVMRVIQRGDLRKPDVFKMAGLKDIQRLFGLQGKEPFCAGFGNRITVALSYRSVNVPSARIVTIDSGGEVKNKLLELDGAAIHKQQQFYFRRLFVLKSLAYSTSSENGVLGYYRIIVESKKRKGTGNSVSADRKGRGRRLGSSWCFLRVSGVAWERYGATLAVGTHQVKFK